MRREAALVVLGCRVRRSPSGALEGALARRADTAAQHFASLGPNARPLVIVAGGRAWSGELEADVLFDALRERGIPIQRIALERCSLSTTDNARFVAEMLRRRQLDDVRIVTCEWHAPRAKEAFFASGIPAEVIGAPCPLGGWGRRWVELRERVTRLWVKSAYRMRGLLR